VTLAFRKAGIDGSWTGSGLNEKFLIANYVNELSDIQSQILVKINPKFYRPAEVELLWGDSSMSRKELDWQPKTSFEQLVEKMVENDLMELKVRPND
jgi:GDPmannose 4,6-dehydratase